MSKKLLGLLKMIVCKILYGNKINFSGIPAVEIDAKIISKNNSFISIGKKFYIRAHTYLSAVNGGKIEIGNRVHINRYCSFCCHENITIGDKCTFGPNVIIYDHDHCFKYGGIKNGFKTSPVIIEPRCWIGAGCIILRGTHIGEGSIIGAGCIVKGNIPANSLVVSKASRELDIEPIYKEE